MRILVLSDSHGKQYNIFDAIDAEKDVKNIIFLGDGLYDIEKAEKKYSHKNFYKVKGNCDSFVWLDIPASEMREFYGKKIFFTHGHEFNVKFGDAALFNHAAYSGADIILYGHTHSPVTECRNGYHILNPGSIGEKKYAVIDIVNNGIMCILKSL
ncbi:MAG: YfcE family phosphodiesterase [Clostridia bacterium]|nr:YfcE family phosphodiesterase [Clostridia bacterium]